MYFVCARASLLSRIRFRAVLVAASFWMDGKLCVSRASGRKPDRYVKRWQYTQNHDTGKNRNTRACWRDADKNEWSTILLNSNICEYITPFRSHFLLRFFDCVTFYTCSFFQLCAACVDFIEKFAKKETIFTVIIISIIFYLFIALCFTHIYIFIVISVEFENLHKIQIYIAEFKQQIAKLR